MERRLIWLAGGQPDILVNFRTDRAKYVGIGSAVFITGTLSAISMSFALYTALRVPLIAAIPFAMAWGLAIMGLDRMLIVSVRRQRNGLKYLLYAFPRLALALLLGFVISTPFTLEIFQPEINKQIAVIQQQNAAAYFRQQAAGGVGQEIRSLRTQMRQLDAVISGSSSRIDGLIQKHNAAADNASAAYAQYQCQLSGEAGCAPGNGPQARTAKQSYQRYSGEAAEFSREIAAAQAAQPDSVRADQPQLVQVSEQLKSDRAQQRQERAAFNKSNAADTGLLIRLQALGQVTAHSGTLTGARWLLFLLFTTFECLPVVVKILVNLGPESVYEKALALDEAAQLAIFAKRSQGLLDAREKTIAPLAQQQAEAELLIEQARLGLLVARGTGGSPRAARRPEAGVAESGGGWIRGRAAPRIVRTQATVIGLTPAPGRSPNQRPAPPAGLPAAPALGAWPYSGEDADLPRMFLKDPRLPPESSAADGRAEDAGPTPAGGPPAP